MRLFAPGARMRRRVSIAAAILLLAPFPRLARAEVETWTDRSGSSIEAELVAAYGMTAFFVNEKGWHSKFPIGGLCDADIQRVIDWTTQNEATRRNRVLAGDSESKLTRFLVKNLVTLQDGKLVPYDLAGQKEPEFYLFYFGASWCGPCRRFAPELVMMYNVFRDLGFESFQVVLVSSDESSGAMRKYMLDEKMPWPAVKFSRRDSREIRRYSASGIPNLVVTTKDGHILLHSYRGKEYIGPRAVLEEFRGMVIASNRKDRLPIGKK